MDNSELKYFNIDWASEYDGPGIRTVLYLQGCHLDCPWCHAPNSKLQNPSILFFEHLCSHCGKCVEVCVQNNHSLHNGKHKYDSENCIKCFRCIQSCPNSDIDQTTGALVYNLKTKTADELFHLLLPQLLFLKKPGGITISGGEPLNQGKAVNLLLSLCKEKGINTAIETSGNLPASSIFNLYKNVDHWLIGLHPWTKHGYQFTDNIYSFLDFLVQKQADIRIRMPLIPDYTDTGESIQTQCKILNQFGINQIDLMLYNKYTSLYRNASGADNLHLKIENARTSDVARVEELFANHNIKSKIMNQ